MFNTPFAHSQKLISDSLILDLTFELPEPQKPQIKIDSVFDFRTTKDPRLIGIQEITHYGVVPVDYFIKTQKPLNQIIQEILPIDVAAKDNYLSLGVKHFELSHQSHFLLFEKYDLKALIEIYKRANRDSLLPVGELVYSSGASEFIINAKLKKGYEKVFGIWSQELIKNLESVSQNIKNNQNPLPYNFREQKLSSPWMQLYTGADFVYFRCGFIFDSYLAFNYPETKRLFSRSTKILRFRRDKKFNSIEYGLMNHSINYRINTSFILRFKCDLFFGINQWKDMKVTKHKVYDALIGDLSLSQSFNFFPIHKKTLFAGFGFFQNVYYIYSKDFKFQPGLKINAGLQL